jgi:hypothetical protein
MQDVAVQFQFQDLVTSQALLRQVQSNANHSSVGVAPHGMASFCCQEVL